MYSVQSAAAQDIPSVTGQGVEHAQRTRRLEKRLPPLARHKEPQDVQNTTSASAAEPAAVPALPPVDARGPVAAGGTPPVSGHDAVRKFLSSLVQPMDHLLLKFVEAGIEDEVSLRGFAALPEEARLKLLRTDLELNYLQSRVVDYGLAQLGA